MSETFYWGRGAPAAVIEHGKANNIGNDMKALQVQQPQSFSLINVPIPVLDPEIPDQILVHSAFISICGSDIPYFNGGKPFHPYPLPWGVPAHEIVGQVLVSTSEHFQVGDWVLAMPSQGKGLAEYFLSSEDRAVFLPKGLGDYGDCCLIQPLSTVLNAVDRLGDLAGKTVAVLGLGSIGLLFCWLLNKRNASRIVGVDPIETRCQIAESRGAHAAYTMTSTEFSKTVQDTNELPEFDICVEAVGHQMLTINDSFDIIRKGGTVLAFGVPDQPVYDIEYESFFRKNAQMIAVVTPEWKQYLKEARDLFLENRGEFSSLVTHRFSIDEVERAFRIYGNHQDNIIKVILSLASWENGNSLESKQTIPEREFMEEGNG